MKYSLMYRLAEGVFRLLPRRTEKGHDAWLEKRKGKREKRCLPPKSMGARRETGPDGDMFWFREDEDSPCAVFYCHGGSYVHDFTYFHWRFLRKLMERTGAVVAATGYRLAPYGSWEDAFRLILPRYVRYAKEHPEKRLILMGDSAGGGLAAALALELLRRGERAPDELILLSPWMDVTVSDPAVDAFALKDPWLTPTLRACGKWWAGKADVRDPRVSPLYGPVEGLRHVTVFVGTREILNPDGVKLFARLDHAGDNELIVGEGMFHVYPLLPIPEAEKAMDKLVEKITRKREDSI